METLKLIETILEKSQMKQIKRSDTFLLIF